VFAFINWQREAKDTPPTDGVWWKEKDGFLEAKALIPNGPGEKFGIKVGDRLLRVNSLPKDRTIRTVSELQRLLYRSSAYSRITYLVDRQGVNVEIGPVFPEPADNSLKLGERIIALIYLGVGLYVLFRRWTAPKSTHFYLFCLVSFVLYSFHYTGKMNAFDQTIYWSSIVACLFQPALFLHFALTFPRPRRLLAKYPWTIAMAYVPGAALLAMQVVAILVFEFSESLRWELDRLQMVYQTLYFAVAAVILWRRYKQASTPLQQQQLKWISRGTVLAIGPYTLFYVLPYING